LLLPLPPFDVGQYLFKVGADILSEITQLTFFIKKFADTFISGISKIK